MVKETKTSDLRKLLGIKRLKRKISISESEKAAVRSLREEEKRRVAHAERLKA